MSHRFPHIRQWMSFILLALLIGFVQGVVAADIPLPGTPSWNIGFDTTRAMHHVNVLASDSLEGRYSGFAGGAKTERYLAGHFANLGLVKPFGEDGYYQRFTYPAGDYAGPVEVVYTNAANQKSTYKQWKDITVYKSSGYGTVTGKLVFVGYGISAPEKGWDDYANIDVNGAIVVVMRGTPELPNTRWQDEAKAIFKARAAQKRGAVAMLSFEGNPPLLASLPPDGYMKNFPVVMISQTVADSLLASTGKTAAGWKTEFRKTRIPASQPLTGSITVTVQGNWFDNAPLANVGGILPGSDPALAKEVVVIGAHHDHHGKDALGNIYYGGNDNASGTATMMELAECFVKNNVKPKRSILFLGFAAEEEWLWGSQYFVEQFPKFGYKVVGMLNMDVVGTGGDTLGLGGLAEYPQLGDVYVSQWPDSVKKKTAFWRLYAGSDHTSFEVAGIPSYVVGSIGGVYKTYHTPEDTAGTVFAYSLKNIGELTYHATLAYANASQPYTQPPLAKASYFLHKSGGIHFLDAKSEFTPPVKQAIAGVRYFQPLVLFTVPVTNENSEAFLNIVYTTMEQAREFAKTNKVPFLADSIRKEWKGEANRGVSVAIPIAYLAGAKKAMVKSLARLGMAFITIDGEDVGDLWRGDQVNPAWTQFLQDAAEVGVYPVISNATTAQAIAIAKVSNNRAIVRMDAAKLNTETWKALSDVGCFALLDAQTMTPETAQQILTLKNRSRIALLASPAAIEQLIQAKIEDAELLELLQGNLRYQLESWNSPTGVVAAPRHPY
ncbi:MAG: M28 family peptidase [bacterium]|nr:M28 family peptidase [bacterium]